jgi:hypothetical protein
VFSHPHSGAFVGFGSGAIATAKNRLNLAKLS